MHRTLPEMGETLFKTGASSLPFSFQYGDLYIVEKPLERSLRLCAWIVMKVSASLVLRYFVCDGPPGHFPSIEGAQVPHGPAQAPGQKPPDDAPGAPGPEAAVPESPINGVSVERRDLRPTSRRQLGRSAPLLASLGGRVLPGPDHKARHATGHALMHVCRREAASRSGLAVRRREERTSARAETATPAAKRGASRA